MQGSVMSLVEELRSICNERGLSAGALSRLAGISRPTAGKVLNGKTNITVRTLGKIYAALHVDSPEQ